MNYSEQLTSDKDFNEIWKKAEPYTMTSKERGYALWSAVNTVIDNGIEGAFVECGVWKGGSSMIIALTLLKRGVTDRTLFMFDTFSGMTAPGPDDNDFNDRPAANLMAGEDGDQVAELVKAAAPLEGVRAAMKSTGYNMDLIKFIEGDVCHTLPLTSTGEIALLRLDTDFYDSTLVEMEVLYPRLVRGGVMIIDDYGHWQGAKKAVEEYFARPEIPYARPMLWAIDYTGRGAIKVEDTAATQSARYDYIPPNMTDPKLSDLFPDAKVSDPMPVQWQYLRKQTPHLWRMDMRHKGAITGNASVEEAVCLYNFARQFSGKRGLEIGSHYGWTAAHLLAAGLKLDCIDPQFARPEHDALMRETFDQVPGSNGYKLWGGVSPEMVKPVLDSGEGPWSFAFIDGDHDGIAPATDAAEVLKYLADDAMVVFHDLTSPHVERGLRVFRDAGWNTRLINTMQILGVAWRGNVTPPDHVADPNVPKIVEPYLQKYLKSETKQPGEDAETAAQDAALAAGSQNGQSKGLLARLFGR